MRALAKELGPRTMRDALEDLRRTEQALSGASHDSRKHRHLKVRAQALRLELALQHPERLAI